MLTILRFHLRGIARHAKGAVKTLLGMNKISEDAFRHSTAAWHQPPVPDHPSLLCICPEPSAPRDQHLDGCPWALRMCTACHADGICVRCGGDAVDPDAPPIEGDEDPDAGLVEVP